ncbi:MAG: DUF5916 domain-containing protein [Acidobacteria bacterium]|nr:DUF5916 domain-containing protein [Acidobacteriota bacterium]
MAAHLVRLAGATILVCGTAIAAERPALQIPRVSEPPVLDRYLDGSVTPPGFKVTGFQQREPGDGVPVSQPTEAYVSYDSQYFYVVFICHDEPGKVRANLTKREAITGDDTVGLILDTYNDGRREYLFLANPLGIQLDGVTGEGQDDDYSYDTLWKSEGRLTKDGYAVLMAVPFKSLRFSNAHAQTWGFALGRIITRTNETAFWPYVTRRIAGFGQQMAVMSGIEGVSRGRNLQAIPYGSFASARILEDAGNRVTETTGRVGLDAKAVVKDAVTVDLTVKPDFSQIESDEPQVTVNQRFEVFFPEKRPFFIENANYFQTPQELFFSRRIADPGVGARVTGKIAGWAFAGLVVNDQRPGHAIDAGLPGHDRQTAAGVFRVQREFARQSSLGAIFTDREFASASNRVFGVDGRWKIDDNWSLTGQWVGSRTTDAQGVAASGSTVFAELQRGGRSFEFSTKYTARSPEFRSDLGYIPRVDMRELEQEIGYTWHPKDSRVLRVGTSLEASAVWDHAGQLQDWLIDPGFELELPGQTELFAGLNQAFERFEGVDFRRHSFFTHVSTQWMSWLNLNGEYSFGTAINYYPAAGFQPFLGREQSAEIGVTLKPSSQLRLDQTYLYSKLATRGDASGCGCTAPTTGDIFSDHIVRSRLNYQFTRALSARAIVDYEVVRPNPLLVDLEHERRFNVDLLFTYLVNPWTAVYVGYTDAYENWLAPGLVQRPVTRGDAPLTSVGRQVFVKMSYLLRY